MNEVRRVPTEVAGVPDAVELQAECAVGRYRTKGNVVLGLKGRPLLHPCKIMASYERYTMSISIPGTATIVTVRLDDLMSVIKEAADASLENRKEADHEPRA